MNERGGDPGAPLFPTRTGRRLSRDAVERRIATHAAAAAADCPSLAGKKLHPHVLRHTCAMDLLRARVGTAVIALWLGHDDIRSTDAYVHADMTIKERALATTTPATITPGRYQPPPSRSTRTCDYAHNTNRQEPAPPAIRPDGSARHRHSPGVGIGLPMPNSA
jgi:hypothetical protein